MSLVQDPAGAGAANVKAASTAPTTSDAALVVAVSPNTPTLPVSVSGGATSANQTNGTQTTRVTDGTNTVAVKAASTAPAVGDPALVVAVSPNTPTLPVSVSGVATASNQTSLGGQTTKINDGTNTAAVKASTTAPAVTDPALVVAVSPNTPTLPVSVSGVATSANQTGLGNQTTKLNDGTNTAAVKAASTAPGVTDPALVVAVSPNTPTLPVSVSGVATASNQTTVGSQTTKVNDGTNTVAVKAASTAAVAGDPALVVAQSPNSPTPPGTNTIGATAQVDGFKTTYSAAITNLTPATTPTDIVTIYGSATKTVRINRIVISGTETTAGTTTALIIKRSAVNTGGTSAAQTAVPHDSNNAAATATVLAYTANPTALGAAVGTLRADKIGLGSATVSPTLLQFDFGIRNDQAVVLRGTAQGIAISLNSVSVTGGSFCVVIEWTEE